MGSSGSCTCNARVCNYHKKGGYGFNTAGENIKKDTQLNGLKDTLSTFMDYVSSPTAYLKTGVQSASNKITVSQEALNKLSNTIASVTPIEGLTMDAFCVNVADSYEKTTTEPFTLEGYTVIKPKQDICSVIICIIIAVTLFAIGGYFIYRYITCPCRKQHEKELREAELRR